MPLHKRTPFIPRPVPDDLRPDESVFYCKLTNEIFRDYEEYFERVILCNSLVWGCSVTGKINLTFEEALESEKQAQRTIHTFSHALKRGLLFLAKDTRRGKLSDVVEDVFAYAREHYFVGETVLGVIGNLWCHSRVTRVIHPTPQEVDTYRREQEAKGELPPNDYLSDDSWGPPPDLYRYEIEELEPDDPNVRDVHILEAIDVKRENKSLTKDKCRYLLKSTMVYDEEDRFWRVREEVEESLSLGRISFNGGLFVGPAPTFEASLGPTKKLEGRKRRKDPSSGGTRTVGGAERHVTNGNGLSSKPPSASPPIHPPKKKRSSSKPKVPEIEPPKVAPSPLELKQMELERRAREKETQKEERKMVVEFKKLWMKPKEDLEVEDLQPLPVGDPVECKIPDELFGDFVMVLEYLNSYASLIRLRDSFPQGVTFETLERALYKTEVAGPLSDILQILLGAIFRLEEREETEVLQEEKASVELQVVGHGNVGVSQVVAVEEATAAATWPLIYQGSPLRHLTLDHLSLSEVLRLHLLSSGARPTDKDAKARLQVRGGYTHREDPGLEFRMEEPEVLKTLAGGTVFDLSLKGRLQVVQCLIHQVLSYPDVRDSIEKNFDQFKETRMELRALQTAERKNEIEDNAWRARLKSERLLPPENFMKNPSPAVTDKTRLLSEEEVEGFLSKRNRDSNRRREEFEGRIGELSRRLQKQDRCLGVHPLGKDRAFRRYWLFTSVPGLFVEEHDTELGPCCPTPTPHIPNIDITDMAFVQKHYKRLWEQENGVVTKKKASKPKPASVVAMELGIHALMGTCTGGLGPCPVHSAGAGRVRWRFLWEESQLDDLIAKLNPRGVRERELRQVLMEEAAGIRDLVRKIPAGKLNLNRTYPEGVERKVGRVNKGGLDPNLNYPPKTPVSTIMELQLRDLILEAEEKISLGTLGFLKVKDRGAWTKAIEGRNFDAQTPELRWGHEKALYRAVVAPCEGSRPESDVIRDLASAILQLEQSVEPKFLKPPLGPAPKEEGEKKRKGEGGPQLRPNWAPGTALTRWETSLMNATSFSQLFVHLFTLDKSISWNRSVLNARCRICRRKGDAENMLLCDGCNKGHHAYCFKPPLEEIPKGDWFCSDCKPPVLPPRLRAPRQGPTPTVSEESEDEGMPVLEEEEVVNEVCTVCGSGGEVICCDGCPALFHLHCLHPPKQRVPRGLWYCDTCKEGGEKRERSSQARSRVRSKTPSESEEEEESEEESQSEEEEERVPVKVRIGQSPRKAPPPSSPSESEEEELGRGVKRRSAYRAVSKIAESSKRLRRSDSKENESSEEEEEEGSDGEEEDSRHDAPERKRTRLQRSNTNRCGDSGDLDNVLLDKLVMDLMRHPDSWPFLKPVTRLDAPDYHDIVKTPMDLGTIKYKLNSMVYTCNQEFLADLNLVFVNCFSYNTPNATVYTAGEDLKEYCKRRCEKAGLQFGDALE